MERLINEQISELFKDLDGVRVKFSTINNGFDAEDILLEFMKNFRESGIEDNQLCSDTLDIVLIGLKYGNIRDDLSQARNHRVVELKDRYKIQTRAKRGMCIGTLSNTMTFARSLDVFPTVASDIIRKGLYIPKPTHNLLFSNELPDVFKHSGFAALIPKNNEVGKVYFYAYLSYSIDFSFMISPNSRVSVKEKYDEQHVFASKAWNGWLIGHGKRVELMNEYEINTRGVLEICLKVANKLLSEAGEDMFDAEKIMETYVDGRDSVRFDQYRIDKTELDENPELSDFYNGLCLRCSSFLESPNRLISFPFP